MLAHQLARGGERVVLPALHSYLRCRQPAATQATLEQTSSSGRCVSTLYMSALVVPHEVAGFGAFAPAHETTLRQCLLSVLWRN